MTRSAYGSKAQRDFFRECLAAIWVCGEAFLFLIKPRQKMPFFENYRFILLETILFIYLQQNKTVFLWM
jgi:hypothetical protein